MNLIHLMIHIILHLLFPLPVTVYPSGPYISDSFSVLTEALPNHPT